MLLQFSLMLVKTSDLGVSFFFNFSKNKNKENIHSLMLEVRCSICGKGEEREDQR